MEPTERELALYVDGVLEQSGGEDDDATDVPKTPEALGYSVVRACSDGLCEEGMHVGGLYCCSGGGYTGRYLNGTIDELRVWTRALSPKELNDKMRTPLAAGDEDGLLFYFPMDEAVCSPPSLSVTERGTGGTAACVAAGCAGATPI